MEMNLGQEIKTVSINSSEPQIVRTVMALTDTEIICSGIDRRFDRKTGWSLTKPYTYYVELVGDPRTWDQRRAELIKCGGVDPATTAPGGEGYSFDLRDLKAASAIRVYAKQHQRGIMVCVEQDGSYRVCNYSEIKESRVLLLGWPADYPLVTARAHAQLHAAWEGFLLKLDQEEKQ